MGAHEAPNLPGIASIWHVPQATSVIANELLICVAELELLADLGGLLWIRAAKQQRKPLYHRLWLHGTLLVLVLIGSTCRGTPSPLAKCVLDLKSTTVCHKRQRQASDISRICYTRMCMTHGLNTQRPAHFVELPLPTHPSERVCLLKDLAHIYKLAEDIRQGSIFAERESPLVWQHHPVVPLPISNEGHRGTACQLFNPLQHTGRCFHKRRCCINIGLRDVCQTLTKIRQLRMKLRSHKSLKFTYHTSDVCIDQYNRKLNYFHGVVV
mmetsp:Transcript_118598/g.347404  ORF Transcript_118598/g.347404 Transcript_118598/m.347404 type:complete len:268 (-) Transcript_118598:1150-1953(-)